MSDYQQKAFDAAHDAKLRFRCDDSPNDILLRELYAVERLAQAIDRNTAALRELKAREP